MENYHDQLAEVNRGQEMRNLFNQVEGGQGSAFGVSSADGSLFLKNNCRP